LFTRKRGTKRYEVISSDGAGITLRVPRYHKTPIYIGSIASCREKGLSPKGRESFFCLKNGDVVMDGYLAKPCEERTVEISIRGRAKVTAATWSKISAEVSSLLNDQ
jgi:hypothetical protein